jgi:hypothetical protein
MRFEAGEQLRKIFALELAGALLALRAEPGFDLRERLAVVK